MATLGIPDDSSPAEAQKRAVGYRAAEYVEDGQVLGLGTGSTVRYLLEALGERVRQGLKIAGTPTSEWTAATCQRLGIPLVDLERQPTLDLTIDGADEIDPQVNLIKGLGGALVREKFVALASKRYIAIGDESKLVPSLGSRAPVPVAVLQFAWRITSQRLEALGARPVLRERDGRPVVTDDGLYVLDCWFGPIADPRGLEQRLKATLGVVSTGLFLDLPAIGLIGHADLSVSVVSRRM